MEKNKKMVFLVNVLSQARCVRRIQDFITQGYDVSVYGYHRRGGRRINFPYPVEVLGEISAKVSYFGRLKRMRHDIRKIVKKEGNRCIYYLFNYDIALAYYSVGVKSKTVYEISDLMELMVGNTFIKSGLVFINRLMMKNADLNVLTSQGFYDYYFSNKPLSKKFLIVPNKLNRRCLEIPFAKPKKFDVNNIKFSFTGAIRSECVYLFAKVLGEIGKHEFHLRGVYTDDKVFSEKIKTLVEKYDNLYYEGMFKNPDDLPYIYSNVDIVCCIYTAKDNDQYLEPNKLYEAIFYEKPIVVMDNTFLSRKVIENGIGYVIEGDKEEKIRQFIESITEESYHTIVGSCKKISKEDSVDNPEQIFERIIKI